MSQDTVTFPQLRSLILWPENGPKVLCEALRALQAQGFTRDHLEGWLEALRRENDAEGADELVEERALMCLDMVYGYCHVDFALVWPKEKLETTSPSAPGPLLGWPRCQTIWQCQDANAVLLKRYYLLQLPFLAVYLHYLAASDEDRALHCHPWSFVTILLTSGYHEHTPALKLWHRRFSILFRPAEWLHRLELMKPCWTLVFRFRRRRLWGFWSPEQGWVDWKTYGKAWCE